MIEQPHFDAYSIPARICFTVALLGCAVLIAVLVTSVYFLE
ncbi:MULTISPECIES: hypothetical protein [Bradyrhizobium]|nr:MULTISPECIES: hypothetical protein [Bradyrhizobium]SDJ41956.1 hypothetical protein SAMN05216338_104911 [Bradyrhizobium sp. Rc2d]